MNCKVTCWIVFALLMMPSYGYSAEPATAAEALEKLDLLTLPLPEGAEMGSRRRVAELGYWVKQGAKDAFAFADKQLTERGWKQLPDAQIQGEFASANYQKDGYLVYLSVSPRQEGEARVIFTHMGNVSLEDVPVPASAEKMYAFTNVVMYKSAKSVEETAKACEEQMTKAGWVPYGGAGDTVYYRKNAVQVDVNVMIAPGQGGATMISLTSKLLSLELPAPEFADDFRYDDGTSNIGFDTDRSHQEVADYYREQLASFGWKATTEKPVKIKWHVHTFFRNAGQEMINIETHDFEGRTRVKLDHQNAAEVAEDELKGRIAAGEKAKYREVEWLPVSVTIPEGLEAEQLEDWAVQVPTGEKDVFAVAEEIEESLTAAGWTFVGKDKKPPVIWERRLEGKEGKVLYLIAVKPPKLPAWVAVVGIGGVKLEASQ